MNRRRFTINSGTIVVYAVILFILVIAFVAWRLITAGTMYGDAGFDWATLFAIVILVAGIMARMAMLKRVRMLREEDRPLEPNRSIEREEVLPSFNLQERAKQNEKL